MSNIRINYLSYSLVPLIKNGNTPILENKPFRVEAISQINTDVGYNSNNPNNGNISSSFNKGNNISFKDILAIEEAKLEELGRKK